MSINRIIELWHAGLPPADEFAGYYIKRVETR
jgi:hypothetical protein